MTISINKLKPGDVVFDVHKERMGNTAMSREGCWRVIIKEVDVENGCVVASWNGNPARKIYARNGKFKWRKKQPEPKKSLFS